MRTHGLARWRRYLLGFGVLAVLTSATAACGDEADMGLRDCADLVDAAEVEVLGDLTSDERDMVDWALQRFDEADLQLPSRIQVGFDPTRALCEGAAGVCLVADEVDPTVHVCEPAGETAFRVLDRRMTLLHELAHVWWVSQGGEPPFGDLETIVGGVAGGAPDVRWEDRSEERLAIVLTWGLLDQPRRPVPTTFSCRQLYLQFEEVTAHAPLGPLEVICISD